MRQIALIGPTASGKTSLSIELAQKTNSIILSLDSLAIYKYVDIVSAKPTKEEQNGIKHFGLSLLEPDEKINVINFISYYYKALEYAKQYDKNLIIVGGTSFYLKIMYDGISKGIISSEDTKQWVSDILKDISKAYQFLKSIDEKYALSISKNDRYRIEKGLTIYKDTQIIPTVFFEENQKKAIFENDVPIFELQIDRDLLRTNIETRTMQIIENGLIDEILFLEKRYKRNTNVLKSIGAIETLTYLDGKISKELLYQQIVTNTYRLAKRQNTFNKSQFHNKQTKGNRDKLLNMMSDRLLNIM